MGERLQSEARTRMQNAIKERWQALSDVPLCHCTCEVWQHEIEAELNGGEVVLFVEGHPASSRDRRCPGYTPDKEGFDGKLQDITRFAQEVFNDIFNK